ncbi:DUF3558 domain-containing protein [Streptomyces sp. NPDC058572]|uniref:DUF3558 domain-containing protein n=1 Tax=Streptomyces sp. NPDC058572 TaxID=3346546 RepID=UPI0036507F36
MQRKAYVPGLAAALLAALVTGCTAGTGSDGSDAAAKQGSTASPAAPPGKYRTLPEPCRSVEASTLKNLLPGVVTLPEEQQQAVLRGTAAVTYDTDRRVACSWKGEAPDASHQLRVDFERVVSYDPAVSDDDRALEVFAKKQAATSVPLAAAPGEGEQTPSATAGAAAPPASDDAKGDGPVGTPSEATASRTPGSGDPDGTPTATPSGSAGSATGLEPRMLEGLGNAAFLDDVLGRAGSTAQRRTVSVVFRTSNVIVTIVYVEQPARTTEVPDSKELQEKAQSLARGLAEQFND